MQQEDSCLQSPQRQKTPEGSGLHRADQIILQVPEKQKDTEKTGLLDSLFAPADGCSEKHWVDFMCAAGNQQKNRIS